MFFDLVAELLQKHEALENACDAFGKSVRKDEGLPILLPEYAGTCDRNAAINSLTQIWHNEPGEIFALAGLVCSSPTTLQKAECVNESKNEFQAAVKKVRDNATGEKTRIDKLIDRALQQEGNRNKELKRALKLARINRLHLQRCYAKIRIMPPALKSISWTWAKTHSIVTPISRNEAVKQAENLTNDEAREIALSLLSKLAQNEKLVFRKKLPNQLRANLVFEEEGSIKRQAVTISGIVLSHEKEIPRYVWKDDPGEAPINRLSRVSTIETEPYIKALRIHLSTGG